MPTANTTSPSGAPTRINGARKPASTKASTARRTGGATKAKATRAKAARTRATHQAESAVRQSQNASRWTISDRSAGLFGDYAERAVLIPVGAALMARDRVVSTVSDTVSVYSSSTKAQAQLRRFERRGATARNRLEREVRKTRVRVERELRQRRREIEDTFNEIEERRDAVVSRVPELAKEVQERFLNLV